MSPQKGLSLNSVLIVILILLALFLSGAAIYLGILSRKDNSNSITDISNKTETPRAFPTPTVSSVKQTRLLVDSQEGRKLLFIQGTVDSFDGTTIKLSWKGDTDSIELWQEGSELSVTYEGQQGRIVKKGELNLNVGDFIMYQINNKILFISPKS